MDRKTELQKIIKNCREELYTIEHKEQFESIRLLVGKYYKFKNSYSCPKNAEDYWWLYEKIEGIDKDDDLYGFEFQTDKYGDINIKRKIFTYPNMDNWIEITEEEFRSEWKKVVKIINSL
jgi:hypothetical protein